MVADLLFHLLCDAQRALVALASPAAGPADVDAVSYWHAFSGGDRDQEAASRHGWWARRRGAPSRPDRRVSGRARPRAWNDADYLLKATGRLPLDDGDRAALGAAAARFPLMG